MMENVLFWAFYVGIPIQGAFRRPNPAFWRLQAPETRILKIHGLKTRENLGKSSKKN